MRKSAGGLECGLRYPQVRWNVSAPMNLEVLLLRHGETAWSLSGQHTGRTDLPLLPSGRAQAEGLRPKLAPISAELVLSSPLRRARETADLAGLGHVQLDDALREWDYGEDEGLTTAQILAKRPAWNFWAEGCPGGERPEDVGRRCDRVLQRVRSDAAGGTAILVAHGHLLRVLIARWLGLPPAAGRYWVLQPASLSRLGEEHGQPVVLGLNRSTP
jgi:broad specificity phosphatase PhoE